MLMEDFTYSELLALVEELFRAESAAAADCKDMGGPGCAGWFPNGGELDIQRCDACERFEDDADAARHVLDALKAEGKITKLPPGSCGNPDCELCFLRVLLDDPDYPEHTRRDEDWEEQLESANKQLAQHKRLNEWWARQYRNKKSAVLIALGENRLAIPCRIFPTRELAEEFCTRHFGEPQQDDDLHDSYGLEGGPVYPWPEKDDDEHGDIKDSVAALFNYYYGGCGRPWGIYIAEVEYDSPFVGWDLD